MQYEAPKERLNISIETLKLPVMFLVIFGTVAVVLAAANRPDEEWRSCWWESICSAILV